MPEFASNTTITINIPYEYNGNTLTLTNFEYELSDANSVVLLPRQADPNFNPANTSSDIIIDAALNASTEKRDVRMLTCYLTTADGEFIIPQVYTLKGNSLLLTPLVDSFMTYPESVLVRSKIAEEMAFYDALTPELAVIALENSFDKLSGLKFQIGTTVISDIKSLTLAAYNALDANFLLAIKKVQIIEANLIVENSPIRDKIRAGIISETIGESSMFFRQSGAPSGRFSELSDDSYALLSRYLYKDVSSAQIWKVNRA